MVFRHKVMTTRTDPVKQMFHPDPIQKKKRNCSYVFFYIVVPDYLHCRQEEKDLNSTELYLMIF